MSVTNSAVADIVLCFVFTVATSMSYLPESSFLRAVVDFLLDAGRKGNCQSHYTSV